MGKKGTEDKDERNEIKRREYTGEKRRKYIGEEGEGC